MQQILGVLTRLQERAGYEARQTPLYGIGDSVGRYIGQERSREAIGGIHNSIRQTAVRLQPLAEARGVNLYDENNNVRPAAELIEEFRSK